MQVLLNRWQTFCQKVLALALVTLLSLTGFLFLEQPSYAADASEQLTSEEQVDRSYDEYGEDAGIREEIYQQRLQEGQNPEKMPKPYKRVLDIEGKREIPETSLLETSVSKARGLVNKVTDNK